MEITTLSLLMEALNMFDGRVPLHLHYSWLTNRLTITDCTSEHTFEFAIDVAFELRYSDFLTIMQDTEWDLDSCSKIRYMR